MITTTPPTVVARTCVVAIIAVLILLCLHRRLESFSSCACTVNGRCVGIQHQRQGGVSGCDLYNNYRTCLKNAQRGFGTVVLNTGELLRRSSRSQRSPKMLRRLCVNSLTRKTSPGFGCPGDTAPLKPPATPKKGHKIELCTPPSVKTSEMVEN